MGGGRGTRLYPLTQFRCKPAVPLAGKYRLVDIPISNCLNSGYNQIYLLTQFNTASLHRHVHEAFRFDGFGGGFVEILSAEQTEGDDNWYQGTADAVRQNLRHIRTQDDSLVLILSGDQLYRMDFSKMVRQHVESGAEVTIATKAMPETQVHSLGVMRVDEQLKIVDFVEKPTDPEVIKKLAIAPSVKAKLTNPQSCDYGLASMGIYIFNASVLNRTLTENQGQDFGKHILPWMLNRVKLHSYIYEGYWEDIGTVRSFFDANMMLTDTLPAFDFFDENSPIYTRARHLPSSKLNSCHVERSIVADGCIFSEANIHRSVIGSRAVIREHSQLENVLMMGADHFEHIDDMLINQQKGIPHIGIGQNCDIRNAILDRNVRIGNNVRLSPIGKPDDFHQGDIYVKDGILCVAKNGIIPDNTIL
ncbi:MAG: glucose-1-phosphate adenylyltransferase [Verrucomicrobia bacterium GWF2_51_19]|nr:MAG: glucose-1-phosphate adenylyltransferase [Verrucomicrobia bacterium GWF2_51_19]